MNTEIYLNHPTFGLLFKISAIEKNQGLFTTLYAQRLFFLVTTEDKSMSFEPISRTDARLLVENRLRRLRGNGELTEYQKLQQVHKQTFL
jgi:PII interaction protein X